MKNDKEKEKYFPFESENDISSLLKEELKEEEKINNEPNKIFNMKFITEKYYIDKNGKKKKKRKERKYKSDDIRKKIKIKFHKTLKNILNNNLKNAGAKKLFKFIPQAFLGNVSQKLNFKYLDYTYKELLLNDFTLNKNDYKTKKIDYNNYINNKNTIEYLEQNKEISLNSGFELIKNMKYKDILKAYFSSKQYEKSLFELKNKKEDFNYIIEYIKHSKNYLNYFGNIDTNKDKDELNF